MKLVLEVWKTANSNPLLLQESTVAAKEKSHQWGAVGRRPEASGKEQVPSSFPTTLRLSLTSSVGRV